MAYDAIVLAGGRGSRLGGADKAAIVLGASSLLERAIESVAAAQAIVVVGPNRPAIPEGALQVREDPPYAGPAAAIDKGLSALGENRVALPLTVVLATDLPSAVPAVGALLSVVIVEDRTVDGWAGADPEGRLQPLLAVYRTAALSSACRSLATERGSLTGASVRQLLEPLRLLHVPLPTTFTADIDTRADLTAARARERKSHGLPART